MSGWKDHDRKAAASVLSKWIEKYGVPKALYTDWKNVYVREQTSQKGLRGKRASDAIWAYVSKAGNERRWDSSRLVITELRRQGIHTYEAANQSKRNICRNTTND